MKDFQTLEPGRKSGSCSRSPDTWPALLIVSVSWSPSRVPPHPAPRAQVKEEPPLSLLRAGENIESPWAVQHSTVCKPFLRGFYLNIT